MVSVDVEVADSVIVGQAGVGVTRIDLGLRQACFSGRGGLRGSGQTS